MDSKVSHGLSTQNIPEHGVVSFSANPWLGDGTSQYVDGEVGCVLRTVEMLVHHHQS